jgi:protein YIPF1/2
MKKEEIPTGWTRFIKVAYYKQYFQVSEKEVIERITYSMVFPHQQEFIDTTQSNPDFYGPFWILTTLIMLLGFVGNFSNYLLSMFSSGEAWNKYFFKLEFIREAIILVYTFGFGVPLALYFILKLNAEKL